MDLKKAYTDQKHVAEGRGLKMMSFDDWLKIWEDSGKLDQRGRGRGMYCMCRYNDEGDYTPENVYIDLFENNLSFAATNQDKAKNLNEKRDHQKWMATRMKPENRKAVSDKLRETKKGNTNVRGRIWIHNVNTGKAHMVTQDDPRVNDPNYAKGRK